MQNIFNKIFKKRNKSIEVQVMSDDEKLNYDKRTVDRLSSQLILMHGVLNYIAPEFSTAWHIESEKDYPLITMKKIDKDKEGELSKWEQECLDRGCNYRTDVEGGGGWLQSFYTIEEAVSYMEKYYEIRSGHLETLFPKL